jgi:SAM-dependent methyltransferase
MAIFGFLFILIFFLFLSILMVAWIHQLYYGIRTDRIMFLPTSIKKIDQSLLQIVSKYISKVEHTTVVELGCGTGNILRFLGDEFNFKKLVGVELDFVTNFIARFLANKSNIEIIQKDIFAYKIPAKSLVYCFLGTEVLDKLNEKGQFDNNLVVCLEFSLSNIEPTEKYILPGFSFQKELFVYDFRK